MTILHEQVKGNFFVASVGQDKRSYKMKSNGRWKKRKKKLNLRNLFFLFSSNSSFLSCLPEYFISILIFSFHSFSHLIFCLLFFTINFYSNETTILNLLNVFLILVPMFIPFTVEQHLRLHWKLDKPFLHQI